MIERRALAYAWTTTISEYCFSDAKAHLAHLQLPQRIIHYRRFAGKNYALAKVTIKRVRKMVNLRLETKAANERCESATVKAQIRDA